MNLLFEARSLWRCIALQLGKIDALKWLVLHSSGCLLCVFSFFHSLWLSHSFIDRCNSARSGTAKLCMHNDRCYRSMCHHYLEYGFCWLFWFQKLIIEHAITIVWFTFHFDQLYSNVQPLRSNSYIYEELHKNKWRKRMLS